MKSSVISFLKSNDRSEKNSKANSAKPMTSAFKSKSSRLRKMLTESIRNSWFGLLKTKKSRLRLNTNVSSSQK